MKKFWKDEIYLMFGIIHSEHQYLHNIIYSYMYEDLNERDLDRADKKNKMNSTFEI